MANRKIRTVLAVCLVGLTALTAGVSLHPALSRSGAAAAPRTYYVDCNSGNDANNGLSSSRAWRSLGKLDKLALAPGDALLFKRGCLWNGPVTFRWQGSAGAPIQIGAYGSGAQPIIAHANSTNIVITGVYLVISDLATQHTLADYGTRASDGQPYGWKVGFSFQNNAHDNILQRVRTSGHAVGINFSDDSHDNHVLDSDLSNNTGMWSDNTDSTGVLLHGTHNEIAYNRFAGNTALKRPGRSISLEIFNSVRSSIHHNVSDDRVFAELGSSSSVTSTNNVLAYNVHSSSYDPQDNGKGAIFVVTTGPGCAYGPVWNTLLYNNTVYLPGRNSQGVVASCSTPSVLTMQNNLIVATQKAIYIGGSASESHNLVWPAGGLPLPNNFVQGQALSGSSRIAAPRFVNAANGNLQLQPGSPAIDLGSGATLQAGFNTDMAGLGVPQGGAVDAGAYEWTSGAAVEQASPLTVPGRIEAEDYNAGGAGVAYQDTSSGNAGGAYRDDDVDIEPVTDTGGGYDVGWITAAEWLRYDITVQSTGTYVINVRVAAPANGASFQFKIDGVEVTGVVSVPSTGGWQNWQTVTTAPFTLRGGTHILRFDAQTDGFNVNYFDVTPE